MLDTLRGHRSRLPVLKQSVGMTLLGDPLAESLHALLIIITRYNAMAMERFEGFELLEALGPLERRLDLPIHFQIIQHLHLPRGKTRHFIVSQTLVLLLLLHHPVAKEVLLRRDVGMALLLLEFFELRVHIVPLGIGGTAIIAGGLGRTARLASRTLGSLPTLDDEPSLQETLVLILGHWFKLLALLLLLTQSPYLLDPFAEGNVIPWHVGGSVLLLVGDEVSKVDIKGGSKLLCLGTAIRMHLVVGREHASRWKRKPDGMRNLARRQRLVGSSSSNWGTCRSSGCPTGGCHGRRRRWWGVEMRDGGTAAAVAAAAAVAVAGAAVVPALALAWAAAAAFCAAAAMAGSVPAGRPYALSPPGVPVMVAMRLASHALKANPISASLLYR